MHWMSSGTGGSSFNNNYFTACLDENILHYWGKRLEYITNEIVSFFSSTCAPNDISMTLTH